MGDKYQIELDEFIERFRNHKDDKIILYGIGRYTATLLKGIKDFHFVGLMDKDPSKTGKWIFGLPVMDIQTAEKNGDMVIINTSETYWDIIYNRIQNIKIPVFYKNGEQAKEKENIELKNPFKQLSYECLCRHMKTADFVSFDFFDTLFMRSVCNPGDVFCLLEIWLMDKWASVSSFTEIRERAKGTVKKHYSLDELYAQIEAISGMEHCLIEDIKNMELQLEKEQLIPRREVLSVLKYAIESQKEIYIISDMYLPESFYQDVLGEYGILVPDGHILLSNMLGMSKADGTMWKYYSEKIVNGRRAFHVGDNQKADVEMPSKYEIFTYQTPNAWEMLSVSSMKDVTSHICRNYDSAVMGCILKELFENPYALEGSDGRIWIKSNFEMGYCVFGPIILTFLLWLIKRSKEDHISTLVFLSRDGYFLKEDFEYLCKLKGEQRHCCYLGISRQLAMAASIQSWEELIEYSSMPYSGSMVELLEDRFEIIGVKEIPDKTLEKYIEEYLPEIEDYLFGIRKNYLHYLGKMQLDNQCGIVDLGYYGNNQKYLNKLTGNRMQGFYFNVNQSEQNENIKNQEMYACFQKKHDLTGKKSEILKRMIYLESYLTAPYGMVKKVDQAGNFVCAKKKKNQEYFQDKVEINQGVKKFLSDYMERFGEFELDLDPDFIDWYYGYCFQGGLEFVEKVKRSFYNDNAMMNRIESMLFY